MLTGYEQVSLFGGAIEGELASTAASNADLLLVPDNQEVYVDSTTEATLILEILEYSQVADDQACLYLFNDLADSNGAYDPAYCEVLAIRPIPASEAPLLDPSWPKYLLKGTQSIVTDRHPEAPRKPVLVYLFLVRLGQVTSDLLFSVSLPAESSSEAAISITEAHLMHFISTLCVKDFGLFG
jgi:hypothetical protein